MALSMAHKAPSVCGCQVVPRYNDDSKLNCCASFADCILHEKRQTNKDPMIYRMENDKMPARIIRESAIILLLMATALTKTKMKEKKSKIFNSLMGGCHPNKETVAMYNMYKKSQKNGDMTLGCSFNVLILAMPMPTVVMSSVMRSALMKSMDGGKMA